jgi:hypothetical protein
MTANVSVFFKERGGLVAVRGEGCFLVDEQGQRHLDTCNNVVSEWRSRWSVGASDTLYTYGWVNSHGQCSFPLVCPSGLCRPQSPRSGAGWTAGAGAGADQPALLTSHPAALRGQVAGHLPARAQHCVPV